MGQNGEKGAGQLWSPGTKIFEFFFCFFLRIESFWTRKRKKKFWKKIPLVTPHIPDTSNFQKKNIPFIFLKSFNTSKLIMIVIVEHDLES